MEENEEEAKKIININTWFSELLRCYHGDDEHDLLMIKRILETFKLIRFV